MELKEIRIDVYFVRVGAVFITISSRKPLTVGHSDHLPAGPSGSLVCATICHYVPFSLAPHVS